MRRSQSRQLIEAQTAPDVDLDSVDAALDFAEEVVGRFHFPFNWNQFSDKSERLAVWLKHHKDYKAVDPDQVLEYLIWLAGTEQRWER